MYQNTFELCTISSTVRVNKNRESLVKKMSNFVRDVATINVKAEEIVEAMSHSHNKLRYLHIPSRL